MTNKKFTPQEKQMPVIKLPFWIFGICLFDLFTVLLVNISLWSNTDHLIVVLISLCFFIPAVVGIIAYTNCVVRFDKNTIVYRGFSRKIQRFSIEQVTGIDEGGIASSVYIEDVAIPVNTRTQNGRWLKQLIEKKILPRENAVTELTEVKQNPILLSVLPIAAVIVAGILLAVTSPENAIGKILLGMFCSALPLSAVIYTIFARRRKLFFDEETILYIDGRKREHRFYWDDLTGFHCHRENLYFRFGSESLIPTLELRRKECYPVIQKAEAVAEAKIEAVRQSEGDIAADRAYIKMFYYQPEGALYRQNLLDHKTADLHAIIVMICILFLTAFVFLDANGITPVDAVFIAVCWAVIPVITATYRTLDKMPYSYARYVARYYDLSANYLEKIPAEKRIAFANLVFSAEDMEKLNLPALYPVPVKIPQGPQPREQMECTDEEARKIFEKQQKKQAEKDKYKLFLWIIILILLIIIGYFLD